MPDTAPSTQKSPPVIEILRRFLIHADRLSKVPAPSQDGLAMWTSGLRSHLAKIYGENSPSLEYFPRIPPQPRINDVRAILTERTAHLQRIVEALEVLPETTKSPRGNRIFIGHGRSPLWRELKDFIAERLGLPWDEFNRESVAGVTTSERLERMMSDAAFAFLVLTAEEEHADAQIYARPNVIHEVGLFQGRLGPRRAIVLLEEGCSEFSNIVGLSQIRFPRGDIAARFEEIRRVLEREGLV